MSCPLLVPPDGTGRDLSLGISKDLSLGTNEDLCDRISEDLSRRKQSPEYQVP